MRPRKTMELNYSWSYHKLVSHGPMWLSLMPKVQNNNIFNYWWWLLAIKISIVNVKSSAQDGHFILDLTAFIDLFNFKIIMHLDIGFLGTIKPQQMQALNPLFIIILIPLFETVVYPLLKRPKPLKRMCAGMLLASVAFIFAGFLQMKIRVKLCNIQ